MSDRRLCSQSRGKGDMSRYNLILLLILCGVSGGCHSEKAAPRPDKTESKVARTSPPAASKPPLRKNSEPVTKDVPPAAPPPFEVRFAVELATDERRQVTLLCQTNLPPGTLFDVTIDPNDPSKMRTVSVGEEGVIRIEDFTPRFGFPPGKIAFTFFMKHAKLQPASIQAIIGEGGARLSGSNIQVDGRLGKRYAHQHHLIVPDDAAAAAQRALADKIQKYRSLMTVLVYNVEHLAKLDPRKGNNRIQHSQIQEQSAQQIIQIEELGLSSAADPEMGKFFETFLTEIKGAYATLAQDPTAIPPAKIPAWKARLKESSEIQQALHDASFPRQ